MKIFRNRGAQIQQPETIKGGNAFGSPTPQKSESYRPTKRIRVWARTGCGAGGATIVLCGIAGELGRFHWALDLFSHFKLQYSAGLLILALAFAAFRWWKTVAAALFALVWQIWPLVLYWIPADSATASESLRVLSFNVHAANQRKPEVVDAIRRSNADLVAIYEVDLRWIRALKKLEPEYQLSAVNSRGDDFGIALLSRGVEHSAQIQYIGSAEVPSIVVESSDRRFPGILVFTHPVPPTSRSGALLRDGQLRLWPNWHKTLATGEWWSRGT